MAHLSDPSRERRETSPGIGPLAWASASNLPVAETWWSHRTSGLLSASRLRKGHLGRRNGPRGHAAASPGNATMDSATTKRQQAMPMKTCVLMQTRRDGGGGVAVRVNGTGEADGAGPWGMSEDEGCPIGRRPALPVRPLTVAAPAADGVASVPVSTGPVPVTAFRAR
jgi:hypothetical protein